LHLPGVDEFTYLEESDPSCTGTVIGVPDPLRLGEYDDVDDKEATGEESPRDAHSVRVMDVPLVVLASLCRLYTCLHLSFYVLS